MPAQPDELLNDCHFTLYFKQPHVMASYSNLPYLRFLPLGAFIYGPDTSLVKNSEERFGRVFPQPVYSGYLTHREGKTACSKINYCFCGNYLYIYLYELKEIEAK